MRGFTAGFVEVGVEVVKVTVLVARWDTPRPIVRAAVAARHRRDARRVSFRRCPRRASPETRFGFHLRDALERLPSCAAAMRQSVAP